MYRRSARFRTRMAPPIAAIMGLTGLLASHSGCRRHAEQTIQDSEGRSFLAQCSSDAICALTEKSGPGARSPDEARADQAGKEQVHRLRSTGRVVGVCGPLRAGTEPAPADCRPVVCESDQDCPPATGLRTGVCINQLCTEPSHAINSDDAVMLCLAGTGLGTRHAAQVERLALGLNCGTPCRIPKPCRQLQ